MMSKDLDTHMDTSSLAKGYDPLLWRGEEFEARFTAIKEFENNVAHSSGGGVRYLMI
jgi:hypothetical protein